MKIENDASLRCEVFNFTDPLVINIKCKAKPNNTSYPQLAYSYTSKDAEYFEIDDSNVDSLGLNFTFYDDAAVNVVVMSTANKNIKYTIDVRVIERKMEF